MRGLLGYVTGLEADVLWATVAAQRVAELHVPVQVLPAAQLCLEDGRLWPCPTVLALRLLDP